MVIPEPEETTHTSSIVEDNSESDNDYLPCSEEHLIEGSSPPRRKKSDWSEWSAASARELQTLKDIWNFCDLPVHAKTMSSKWVVKIKNANNVKQYKARLVARGFE
ncbi:hypothetical protein EVAR_88215_1 [Eumeta japonica]|uniref:Reverse transcriptase Ty1/copia-type domain-containing protein n=1 Tax=Eumeta variegata TaxID=151549 RepID=A0A4C1YYG7_EUMVA|nr:hypothetical protein EVAR_88215_1 [Eumeta japonica]